MSKKRTWIAFGLLFGLVGFVMLAGGCAQTAEEAPPTTTTACGATTTTAAGATTTTTTTTTSTTSTTLSSGAIAGSVKVPASALTAGVKASGVKAAAVAPDGISDTPIPAMVRGYDPVLDTPLTNFVTADSSGIFLVDPGDWLVDPSGWLVGGVLLKATYAPASGKTTFLTALASPGATSNLYAGTAVVTENILAGLKGKYGDLLSKATTLSAVTKDALLGDIWSNYSVSLTIVGTLAAVPTLTYSGKTIAEIEKAMLGLGANFDSEHNASTDTAAKNTYASCRDAMLTNSVTLAVWAAYPAGTEISTDYGHYGVSFMMPPIANPPSGLKFVGSGLANASFFHDFKDKIDEVSGLTMQCPATEDLAGKLPSGTIIASGTSFMGSGWQNSGMLPVNAKFSGVNLADLPGIYLPPGASLDASVVIPTGVYLDQGFVVQPYMNLATGYPIPSYCSFDPNVSFKDEWSYTNYSLKSGMMFESGFTLTSGMLMESGFKVKSGMNVGYAVPSGMRFDSNYVMYSGMQFASNYVPPSNIIKASGFVEPTTWSGQQWYSNWKSGQSHYEESYHSYYSGQNPPQPPGPGM